MPHLLPVTHSWLDISKDIIFFFPMNIKILPQKERKKT